MTTGKDVRSENFIDTILITTSLILYLKMMSGFSTK